MTQTSVCKVQMLTDLNDRMSRLILALKYTASNGVLVAAPTRPLLLRSLIL